MAARQPSDATGLTSPPGEPGAFAHRFLPSGVEFAADVLPSRGTVALLFRMLAGVADEPDELEGVSALVERTLAKGTQNYSGQQLADAFDARGIQWSSASGRQSMIVRAIGLPEFAGDAIELVAEMLRRPTFPDDACDVALRLASEELKHIEDEPQDLLQMDIQRLTLGPRLGRNPGGTLESLARITPDAIRAFWRQHYQSSRLQVVCAGPVDVESVARRVDRAFAGFGGSLRAGREVVAAPFTPARRHRPKELKQEYIGITLPGVPKGHPSFPAEQVLMGVLSGGMSGRLFSEVREKLGLVYWVAGWHEQPRGLGVIHLGASTTPERCEQTYQTLLRELQRVGEDLREDETIRAREQLIAHAETEDDLTPARAAGLSDDLFQFSRPIGPGPKIEAVRRVTPELVREYARSLRRDTLCLATVGPKELS